MPSARYFTALPGGVIMETLTAKGDPCSRPRSASADGGRQGRRRRIGRGSAQSLRDLQQRGRATVDILAELQRIDRATVAGLDSHAAGSVRQWKPVAEKNPEGLGFVVDPRDRIVAYWQFVALKEEPFARAVRGEIDDDEITADQVCRQQTPGVYDIYTVMVGAVRQYRGQRMIWLLMDTFFHRLEELAERDVFVRYLCANAFTTEGRAICRLGEMQHLGPHQRCGDVYLLDLPNADWLLSRLSGSARTVLPQVQSPGLTAMRE